VCLQLNWFAVEDEQRLEDAFVWIGAKGDAHSADILT
jgi:hypothetical protein